MSKPRSFAGLGALRNLVSDSMAIDMGSVGTIVSVRGRGVVIDEPSLVAVNKITGEAIAFGLEAHKMQGREARDVTVLAPLVDGVVADFERTSAMLAYFVRKARSGISHFSRRAVMSVLAGVSQVEQRALLSAAAKAHIGRVYMVEEGLAAAIGAGVPVDDSYASAVVDIGGDTTNVAVIANGTIISALAMRVGGADINVAIMDFLRRHRGLSIGIPTAERLKHELGSAVEPKEPQQKIEVRGADVKTGAPRAVDVTAAEVYQVTQPVVHKIAEDVLATMTELPAEVSGDIYDRGIILTGGGALLEGMGQYLQNELVLTVRVADEPRFATVRGLSQIFDEPFLLRRVTRTTPHPLLDTESTVFED